MRLENMVVLNPYPQWRLAYFNPLHNRRVKGRGWVSWSSRTSRLQRDHVDLVLCYDDVRVIHKAMLNMASIPSLGVAFFSKLEVTYSLQDDFEAKSSGWFLFTFDKN